MLVKKLDKFKREGRPTATNCKLFSVNPPYGRYEAWISPCGEGFEVPMKYPQIPGYIDRTRAVLHGEMSPFWGTEYKSSGASLGDFVSCGPMGIVAVSERFKELLLSEQVGGLHFGEVIVDGEVPMYILGVEGRVDVDVAKMELALLDGAEMGLYRHSGIYVNKRVMTLMRKGKIKCYRECVVPDRRE